MIMIIIIMITIVIIIIILIWKLWEGGEGRTLSQDHPPADSPKFRSLFSLSHHNFLSFFPLLGGLLVEFWWCLKRRSHEMFLGWSASPAFGRRRFHQKKKTRTFLCLCVCPGVVLDIREGQPQPPQTDIFLEGIGRGGVQNTTLLLPPRPPALSRLEVGLENRIHPIFLEEFLVLLLVPDAPGLKWMFYPKDFDGSICDWEYEFVTLPER